MYVYGRATELDGESGRAILQSFASCHFAATLPEYDSSGCTAADTHRSSFTNAQPRYWESYARIRWAVPTVVRDKLVVLGGFIGSTEDGRTTTLGRGGSDLTASIVGAAINAEEIQVWKDVDGMMSCDPRLRQGNYRVNQLSYDEATEFANSGATILHPETMVPVNAWGFLS